MRTTITEALAMLHVTDKKIAKRREEILKYACRVTDLMDPIKSDGGSQVYVEKMYQSVEDLLNRMLDIKRAIRKANEGTELTVGKHTLSVADWLEWRRTLSVQIGRHNAQVASTIQNLRDHTGKMKREASADSPNVNLDVMVNLNEEELARAAEEHEVILAELDGKLSLLNATTYVEMDDIDADREE